MGSQTFDCRYEVRMDSIDRIKKLIKENKLLHENEKIVAGVSGGADSVCLLLVLKDILNPGNIVAVHINHGIRGEEAARDEEFVKRLCEKYNICLEIRHLSIPEYSKKHKISEEEAGRILRYEVFEEIRQEKNADKIAVAHNMNDTAETFLLNLSRGSGITGLTGIKIISGRIIRPLIKTSRDEIEKIAEYYGEAFITDSTNNSLIYARNRIRNKVLPELSQVNEQAVRHINEAADKLGKIEGYLLRESEKAYKKYVDVKETLLIKNAITEIDAVLIEEVLHRALTEVAGKARDIGSIHISYLNELFSKQVGREINLPYEIRAYRDYEGVRLISANNKENADNDRLIMSEPELTILEIDGISEVLTEGDNIQLTMDDGSIKNLLQNSCIRWFDYDKISENVLLRYRKDGDYIIISDKGDRKKLKKYFTDSKIPSEKRDNIPVIACGNEILWVVGYRTGEGARITRATKKLLKMELKWK